VFRLGLRRPTLARLNRVVRRLARERVSPRTDWAAVCFYFHTVRSDLRDVILTDLLEHSLEKAATPRGS